MKRATLFLGFLTLIFVLGGCGRTADHVVEEQIMLLDEMADAYDNDAPGTTIIDIQERMNENDKRLEELKMTKEVKRDLVGKYRAEIKRAEERVTEAKAKYMKRRGEASPDANKSAPEKK